MRIHRILPVIVCCSLVATLGGACSSGASSKGKAPDTSKIATATLPAKLPDPKILSNSAVQTGGGGSSYTIKDGDTLAGIASKLGIALADLRAANPGLDPQTLRAGQSVKLPQNTDAAPPTAPTATPAGKSATARAATETPAPAATEPPPTEAPATATAAPPPPQETPAADATATPASVGQTYTVEQGDFPAKIAAKFGITVEELLAANPGINPTDMHIGDVIIIPPKRGG